MTPLDGTGGSSRATGGLLCLGERGRELLQIMRYIIRDARMKDEREVPSECEQLAGLL